jgi:ribose 5-phosphate isomerase B
MNVICLGGRVTGDALALDLVQTFLKARFRGERRFRRRLKKMTALEINPARLERTRPVRKKSL